MVPNLNGHFELGRTSVLREGEDLLLVSMGAITAEVAAAAEILAGQGVECEHRVVSSLNPAPVDDLAQALRRFRLVLTVEAHYICGGLGSLVSEVIAEHGFGSRIVRCAVRLSASSVSGGQRFLERRHRLNRESVVETALLNLAALPT